MYVFEKGVLTYVENVWSIMTYMSRLWISSTIRCQSLMVP